MKRADVVRAILANGGVLVREGQRHAIYRIGVCQTSVARHREVPLGTARAIERQLAPCVGVRSWLIGREQ